MYWLPDDVNQTQKVLLSKGFTALFSLYSFFRGHTRYFVLVFNQQKVDGVSTVNTCLQFDLHFDRAFCFEAGAYREKEDFLESLASVCSKHLNNGARPPTFENVSQKVRKPLPSATGKYDFSFLFYLSYIPFI